MFLLHNLENRETFHSLEYQEFMMRMKYYSQYLQAKDHQLIFSRQVIVQVLQLLLGFKHQQGIVACILKTMQELDELYLTHLIVYIHKEIKR